MAGEEKAWFIELVRNAQEPNWLEHSPDASPGLTALIEYERSAAAIFNWQPVLIPGVLQTAAYAREILTYGGLSKNEIEQRLMIRLARREILGGPAALRYTVLLGELTFRQGIGGKSVMLDQLHHLIAAAERSNVVVRVLPTGNGYHPGLSGSFAILDFADLPPIVHAEHYRGSVYLYTDEKVADYRAAAKTLAALALNDADSIALIQGVIAELEA